VLLTELPTNTGKSVTNAIEEILEIVLQRLQAPLEKVCIVEHYPQRGVTPPTFDEVHFPSGNLENPSWRRIPQQLVDELRACRERPR
jgi:hypothetical protein